MVERGASIVMETTARPYGTRDGQDRDTFGHLLTAPIEQLSSSEMGTRPSISRRRRLSVDWRMLSVSAAWRRLRCCDAMIAHLRSRRSTDIHHAPHNRSRGQHTPSARASCLDASSGRTYIDQAPLTPSPPDAPSGVSLNLQSAMRAFSCVGWFMRLPSGDSLISQRSNERCLTLSGSSK